MLFVGFLVKKFPKIEGSGLPQTQALLYGRIKYNRPFTSLLIKFIGGVLSLGTGLSLGREGSSVQMGSLIGYITGNVLKVKEGLKRHLIAAGAGAGVSAAFTAPLSSSILVLESFQKFNMPQMSICTLLAGITSGVLAKLLIPHNIYNGIEVVNPQIKEWRLIIICLIMAVFFSLLGKIFSTALIKGKILYSKLDSWRFSKYTKGIVPKAALLTVITFTIGLYLPTLIGGNQTFLIESSGSRYLNMLYLLSIIIIISLFTILSNSTGYPGGIFLPMITIGGLAGKLFYEILQKSAIYLNITAELGITNNEIYNLSGFFILIGMSAFFISVVRTPLTGFILISEMTGNYDVFFPTVVVGVFVYFFTELLKVTPMNELIYNFMIKKEDIANEKTTIYLDINNYSYFIGKTLSTVNLPKDCNITFIYRDRRPIKFTDSTAIQAGDQVGVEVYLNEVENIYQSLVSMSY